MVGNDPSRKHRRGCFTRVHVRHVLSSECSTVAVIFREPYEAGSFRVDSTKDTAANTIVYCDVTRRRAEQRFSRLFLQQTRTYAKINGNVCNCGTYVTRTRRNAFLLSCSSSGGKIYARFFCPPRIDSACANDSSAFFPPCLSSSSCFSYWRS